MKYRATPGASLWSFGDGTPTVIRAAIIAALNEQPRSAAELSEYLDRPLGTIAYHVRVLLDAGLIVEDPDEEEAPLKDL